MEVQEEHIMEKRSTVVILGIMLGICLVVMIFLGNALFESDASKVLLEKQNAEYIKEVDELRGKEVSIRENADSTLEVLEQEVVDIKEDSNEKINEIEENVSIELTELDTIEFYPLYLKLSDFGGAEAED